MAQVAAGASLAVDCPKLANGRFIIKAKLGNGSFGDIFAGVDTWNSMDVAIKLEHVKARHPQLQYEARVYKLLHASGQAIGIPNMYWAGTEGDYHAMVMDLCGPCLEDLFTYCGRIFTMKTTLQLADQLLHRIQHMHTHHFLHRDIKPENFVMGTGSRAHHVNIVDFGLSKRFFDPKLHQPLPYKEGKPLTGTARYWQREHSSRRGAGAPRRPRGHRLSPRVLRQGVAAVAGPEGRRSGPEDGAQRREEDRDDARVLVPGPPQRLPEVPPHGPRAEVRGDAGHTTRCGAGSPTCSGRKATGRTTSSTGSRSAGRSWRTRPAANASTLGTPHIASSAGSSV
jgi:serine/threonine protein kinase